MILNESITGLIICLPCQNIPQNQPKIAVVNDLIEIIQTIQAVPDRIFEGLYTGICTGQNKVEFY